MILMRVGCAALAGRAGGSDLATFQDAFGFVLELIDYVIVVRIWKREEWAFNVHRSLLPRRSPHRSMLAGFDWHWPSSRPLTALEYVSDCFRTLWLFRLSFQLCGGLPSLPGQQFVLQIREGCNLRFSHMWNNSLNMIDIHTFLI